MNTLDSVVFASGLALIGAIYVFFFGVRDAAPTTPHGGVSRQADLTIAGMTCAACVARVEKAARRVPGVTDAAVNLLANRGTFGYDPAQTDPAAIAARITKIGYDTALYQPATERKTADTGEGRKLTRQFVLAALLTLPVLAGAMGSDFGLPIPAWLRSPWTQFVLTTPVLFWAGSQFFRGAWAALRGRSADMNTLIALGTGTAYGYSLAETLGGGHGEVYFETASVIVTLLLLGRSLETV